MSLKVPRPPTCVQAVQFFHPRYAGTRAAAANPPGETVDPERLRVVRDQAGRNMEPKAAAALDAVRALLPEQSLIHRVAWPFPRVGDPGGPAPASGPQQQLPAHVVQLAWAKAAPWLQTPLPDLWAFSVCTVAPAASVARALRALYTLCFLLPCSSFEVRRYAHTGLLLPKTGAS